MDVCNPIPLRILHPSMSASRQGENGRDNDGSKLHCVDALDGIAGGGADVHLSKTGKGAMVVRNIVDGVSKR